MPEAAPQPFEQLLRDDTSTGFAPPMRLPDVIVTPPRAPTRLPQPNVPSRPSIGTRIAQGAARLGGRLLTLLTPMSSGPEGTGNLFGGPGALYPPGTTPPAITLPEPMLELEPVYITPPPKGPSRVSVAPDEINPPNWWDIATERPGETFRDWNRIIDTATNIGRRLYDAYSFLNRLDDRRTPQPLISVGELSLPSGPDVFPELEPGYFSSPSPSPASPGILPDPFKMPDLERVGSPFADPFPSTRPGTVARPGTRPETRTPANPTGPLSPFFQLPENYRPARPAPSRPQFLTDSTPSLLEDPIGEREFASDPDKPSPDACQCDKPPKKKKPKSKPREVCKQGTYTQRAKGIMYAPKRTVPCESGAIEAQRKSKKPKTRRPAPGQFPSLTNYNWS